MDGDEHKPTGPDWRAASALHRREIEAALRAGENPLLVALDMTSALIADAYQELTTRGESGRQDGVFMVEYLNQAVLGLLEQHDKAGQPVDLAALVAATFMLQRLSLRAWLKAHQEATDDAQQQQAYADLLAAYEAPFRYLEAVRLQGRAN